MATSVMAAAMGRNSAPVGDGMHRGFSFTPK